MKPKLQVLAPSNSQDLGVESQRPDLPPYWATVERARAAFIAMIEGYRAAVPDGDRIAAEQLIAEYVASRIDLDAALYREVVAAHTPEWTATPPTEPGFYWVHYTGRYGYTTIAERRADGWLIFSKGDRLVGAPWVAKVMDLFYGPVYPPDAVATATPAPPIP
jgi:hypothetical protein